MPKAKILNFNQFDKAANVNKPGLYLVPKVEIEAELPEVEPCCELGCGDRDTHFTLVKGGQSNILTFGEN